VQAPGHPRVAIERAAVGHHTNERHEENVLTAAATTTGPTPARATGSVLLVDDDESFVARARPALESAGYSVTTSPTGVPAHEALAARPDVVVADVASPAADGFELLRSLRASPAGRPVPVILLTADGHDDVETGLRLGADDCVGKRLSMSELVARVRAKTVRPPVPADLLRRDLRTGLLAPAALAEEADRELVRGRRVGRPGGLAVVRLQETPALVSRFGSGAAAQMAEQLIALLQEHPLPLERLGLDRSGRLFVLLPETGGAAVEQRLAAFAARVASSSFTVAGETVRVTPVTGWARFADAADGRQLLERAETATEAAGNHLDLLPVTWSPALRRPVSHRRPTAAARLGSLLPGLRLPAQVLATFVLGMGLPFAVYVLLGCLGWDVSGPAYWMVMTALVVTAGTIWIEGLHALDPSRPPAEPGAPHPAATAVVAAYLPNEAATIIDTVEAFQRIDYPGPLQILVAYNTPHPMAVEEELREIARRDPRVMALKVENSTSKAQNVNAAMSHVRGEFVGMFDADHHPDPLAFRRAWRWLSNGYDVVQGHCVVRNGHASLVARTVAVEFEAIYAVSHPGRAALHGFGLFGGSNGYWRTELLARTRMHGSMLTEDIDSTLRVLSSGARIASDPALVSTELAPTTWRALWNQRARWAQGWFQVSRKHLWTTLRSPLLSRRQKLGMMFLLGWREIYPWLSLQMFPVLAYGAYRDGGVTHLHWAVPALLLATLFTLTVGPAQTLFAWRLAVPALRREPGWFWGYLLVASLFYTEWKNVVARVAQVKELLGEHHWNVTPRAVPAAAHRKPPAADDAALYRYGTQEAA
jgi:cellulose synthase/poly-beta-1,6-N-acetylglucosamine synthase-like glycosyltransferase/PleD family two-component response regulator